MAKKNSLPKFEQSFRYSRSEIMTNNFLGGISWAVGSIIGIAIVGLLITGVLKYINVIPVIGNFVADIVKYIQQHQ